MKLKPNDILIIDPKNTHNEFLVIRVDKAGKTRIKENGLWYPTYLFSWLDIDKFAEQFGHMIIEGGNE